MSSYSLSCSNKNNICNTTSTNTSTTYNTNSSCYSNNNNNNNSSCNNNNISGYNNCNNNSSCKKGCTGCSSCCPSTLKLVNEISWNISSGSALLETIGSAQLSVVSGAIRVTCSSNGQYGIRLRSRLYGRRNDRLRLKVVGLRNFSVSNVIQSPRYPFIFMSSSLNGVLTPTNSYLQAFTAEITENIMLTTDDEISWGVLASNGIVGDSFNVQLITISQFSVSCGNAYDCKNLPIYYIPGYNPYPIQPPINIDINVDCKDKGCGGCGKCDKCCPDKCNCGKCDKCCPKPQKYDSIYDELYCSPCVVPVNEGGLDTRYSGYFRMFNADQPLILDAPVLSTFTQASNQSSVLSITDRNQYLDVGRVFLGQFIFNDISFLDLTQENINQADLNEAINLDTPQLDLRSVYGGYNLLTNALYSNYMLNSHLFVYNQLDNDLLRLTTSQGLFIVSGLTPTTPLTQQNLFSQLTVGEAMIPDRRNDNNLILAQIHLIWQKFHNYVYRRYLTVEPYNTLPRDQLFVFVQKQVRFYFQWIVVNDFLPYFVENDILDVIFKKDKTRLYNIRKSGDKLPFECVMCAFNTIDFTIPDYIDYGIVSGTTYEQLNYSELAFYTKGNLPTMTSTVSGSNVMRIDWNKLFVIDSNITPIKAKKFNTNIMSTVDDVFDNYGGISSMNTINYVSLNGKLSRMLTYLYRGYQVDLESAQDISENIGLTPIPANIILSYISKPGIIPIANKTPLLLYMLIESQILARGEVLSGIGGIILAEIISSILNNDPLSYINTPEEWYPQYPVIPINQNDITFQKIIELSQGPLGASG